MAWLTESLIRKHLQKPLATSKGHLQGQQKNIKTTKDYDSLTLSTSLDVAPIQEPYNPKTNNIFSNALLATESLSKSFCSDQTFQFSVQSGRGNNYIFIMYRYD